MKKACWYTVSSHRSGKSKITFLPLHSHQCPVNVNTRAWILAIVTSQGGINSTVWGSRCALHEHEVPLVALEAAESNSGLWARVLLEVCAPAHSTVQWGWRRRAGRCRGRNGDPCWEGDGHSLDRIAVPNHGALALLGLLLLHAFDLGLAGFRQSLYRLVLVLLCLLGSLQASLSGTLLPLLHHLSGHLFLLVAHGELQERLTLLLV